MYVVVVLLLYCVRDQYYCIVLLSDSVAPRNTLLYMCWMRVRQEGPEEPSLSPPPTFNPPTPILVWYLEKCYMVGGTSLDI